MKPLQDFVVDNIKNAPPSGIRKYFDLINEMKDAISLGIGEPDFVTPWAVRETGIHSLEKGHTHYSSNAGFIEFRQEIANYMERRFKLSYNAADEILVTVGGSEAIDVALRTLVGPGDEVILPEPSFVAYQGCTLFTGATPVTIDTKAENDFRLTAAELEAAITDKTKVLILAYPSNPTGAIMEYDDYAPLVEVLKDKDIIVISDELYAELTYGTEHVSIANFPEMKERTIVVNGLSKAFAMTGWRIGFACGPHVLLEEMKKIHQYAIMCAPTTAQYAAIEALKNGAESVEEMKKEYNRRRRFLVDGFRKLGLDCFEPRGAFYVFPDISISGMTSDDFCEGLLMKEEVLMVPGNAFGVSGAGYARATYATSMEKLAEALVRIERYLKSLK